MSGHSVYHFQKGMNYDVMIDTVQGNQYNTPVSISGRSINNTYQTFYGNMCWLVSEDTEPPYVSASIGSAWVAIPIYNGSPITDLDAYNYWINTYDVAQVNVYRKYYESGIEHIDTTPGTLILTRSGNYELHSVYYGVLTYIGSSSFPSYLYDPELMRYVYVYSDGGVHNIVGESIHFYDCYVIRPDDNPLIYWSDIETWTKKDIKNIYDLHHAFTIRLTKTLSPYVSWKGGGITNLTIDDNVEYIGEFNNSLYTDQTTYLPCNYFNYIKLPSSLISIENNAFANNPYLTYIDLNNYNVQTSQHLFNSSYIEYCYGFNNNIYIQGHGVLTRFINHVNSNSNLELALNGGRVPVIKISEYSFYSRTTGIKYINMYNVVIETSTQIEYPFKYICYTVSGINLPWQLNRTGDNRQYAFLLVPLKEVQTNQVGDKAIYVEDDNKYYKLLDTDLEFNPFPANMF